MAEVVERVDMKAAEGRYQLGPTALKMRLRAVREALGLEPAKEGNKNYLQGELLAVMDGLNEHMAGGGTQTDFLAGRSAQRSNLSRSLVAKQPERLQTAEAPRGVLTPEPMAAAVGIVAEAVAERLAAKWLRDPLYGLRALKEAAEEGWELTTTQVAQLLGMRPATLRGGEKFDRHGFRFERVGKIGREAAWRVTRG